MSLAAISGRWTTLVLRDLMLGPLTFGQLRAGLPALSAKVLTERLVSLRHQGIVTRGARGYELTERGRLLRPLLAQLYRTGEALLAEP
ncbi:winged helix-turn-helix transcriptional regulator [Actinophytocola xanthii]|uniref:winged helix-turn-helix transcriptional regulator n=1 Tax=Actinophytocola xanthii TaxID=1912961 RepID=UPI000B005C03|nr:helix-turn-helix domain-containing protein [Actinophytocola xanthii]